MQQEYETAQDGSFISSPRRIIQNRLSVCSFSCVTVSGESWNARFSVRLSSSLILKRSCKQSSINTVISYFQLRSASCLESGCCCPGQSLFTTLLTQLTASQRGRVESGRTNYRDEQERTETGNQVGSFLLKNHSFKLIRSQMTHHYSWERGYPG